MTFRSILIFLIIILCSPSVWAINLNISTGGSIKSLNFFLDDGPLSKKNMLSVESFRLDLRGRLWPTTEFEFSLEQRLLWANRSRVVGLKPNTVNRYLDLETVQNDGGKLSGSTQIDRFNFHTDHGSASLTVGRQAIGFGRISLFSPLDVIAPFSPDAVDVDVRPGVDAVKINSYFGLAGQLGGIAVFGDEKDHNSYLITAGQNIAKIDLLFLGGTLRGRSMVGVGLAGEIGTVGLKSEISWYRGTDVGQSGGDLNNQYSVAALESWYRFDNGLILLAEYLYNGFGSQDPQNYAAVANSAPIKEGLGFLLGRQYLLLGPSFQIHPLVTLNGLLIYNLKDDSMLLRPLFAVSLADNLQLDLFWSFTSGRKPSLNQLTGLPVARSEFGSLAESGGLFLRWYF
jgi:hypothetical protein